MGGNNASKPGDNRIVAKYSPFTPDVIGAFGGMVFQIANRQGNLCHVMDQSTAINTFKLVIVPDDPVNFRIQAGYSFLKVSDVDIVNPLTLVAVENDGTVFRFGDWYGGTSFNTVRIDKKHTISDSSYKILQNKPSDGTLLSIFTVENRIEPTIIVPPFDLVLAMGEVLPVHGDEGEQ